MNRNYINTLVSRIGNIQKNYTADYSLPTRNSHDTAFQIRRALKTSEYQ